MTEQQLSDALGELDSRYIDEALRYRKRRRRRFLPLIAACACLLLAVPLTAFAIDAIEYHAAAAYLQSLGIPVAAFRDYSRREIKEAAQTMDAGESSPLTEALLARRPGAETPAQVTSAQVRALTPAMTREEVLTRLGDTQDIGSGLYVYVYEVDQRYWLQIPFAGDEAQLGVSGDELLQALIPISEGDIP